MDDVQDDKLKALSERENPPSIPDLWLGGNTVRLTPAQRRKVIAFCLKRDGPRCMIPICPNPGAFDPRLDCTIHHGDRGPGDHHASNLCLAHSICNRKVGRVSSGAEGALRFAREREKGAVASVTTSLDVRRPLSAEIVKNEDYEPLFRRKCFEKLLEIIHKKGADSMITQKDLRKFARVWVGCSAQTSYSYMEPLFSEGGPFLEEQDLTTNDLYVRFRVKKDSDLTVPQLEAKYPKTGKRYSKEI